jgi:hypothetical protein
MCPSALALDADRETVRLVANLLSEERRISGHLEVT